MAGNGSNILRTVLKERGWSHSKLVAELRRQAAATGEGLPKTESLLTLVSRWVNNRQQPDDFYRDLLARALDRPAAELFGEEDQAAELEAGAEPWRLARVLELSSVGAASLEAIELAVADFARRYPSTPPATLLDPVASHYRDVSRLLEGPLPVAHRRRLVVVAGVLAGLAGNLAFDLKQRPRAEGYFSVAPQAAHEAEHAGPSENRLGTDFFDLPRLLAFKGTCALLLRQPRAARAALAEGLALRPPSDVKGRSLARLDLAAAHVQERELELAHT